MHDRSRSNNIRITRSSLNPLECISRKASAAKDAYLGDYALNIPA